MINPTPTVVFTHSGYIFDSVPEELTKEAALKQKEFIDNRDKALYELGLTELPAGGDPAYRFLYLVSSTFFKVLMRQNSIEVARERVVLNETDSDINKLNQAVPFVIGSEWVDNEWIGARFDELLSVFADEIKNYNGTVELYFTEKSQNLKVPERIFFHLVENKTDNNYPFAFMATYAGEDENKQIRHRSLEYALTEYKDDREKLLSLLSCLNRVSEVSNLIAGFIESGEMFHPLRLTSDEAYVFLTQIEQIEACGVLCRIPNWWKHHTNRPRISVSVGEKKPSLLGFDSLVQLQPQIMVDGSVLSMEEIQQFLKEAEGLHLIKGRWIEVNHEKLRALLNQIDALPHEATLLDILRGDVSIPLGAQDSDSADIDFTNGQWLNEFLDSMRRPEKIENIPVPDIFRAELRPYQRIGYSWLNLMHTLGFGACLADDMGLGKTIQVLCWLAKLYVDNPSARVLLIVPASLIGNWEKEKQRFVPAVPMRILHGKSGNALSKDAEDNSVFLTVTSYGMAVRLEALKNISWTCVILDEAQAIKIREQSRQGLLSC